MDGCALGIVGTVGAAAATTTTTATATEDCSDALLRAIWAVGVIGRRENVLQFLGDGLGIGVCQQEYFQIAVAGAVQRLDDLREVPNVRVAGGHDDGVAAGAGIHLRAFGPQGEQVFEHFDWI